MSDDVVCVLGELLSKSSDRATEKSVTANQEAARQKLKMRVLAAGSKDFIGREVEKQMQNVAEYVLYLELKYGHQLTEECPDDLAKN